MTDAMLTRLMDAPVINWAGGYKPEKMNERRKQYIVALRHADGHDFRALFEFFEGGK